MDCIGTQNLKNVLQHKVELFADREFLVFEDKNERVSRLTYKDFYILVNKFANLLYSKGIKKGDKVIVHLGNCPEHLISFFAIASIGAVMVPTNILSTAREMEHFINHSDSVAVISEPCYYDLIKQSITKVSSVRNIFLTRTSDSYQNQKYFPDAVIVNEVLSQVSANEQQVNPAPGDVLLIMFSSGTSSRYSAVELTHANAVFAGIFGAQAWRVSPDDRHLIVLPLFHINGLFMSTMPTFTAGGTLVMEEQFSASKYMVQVHRHKITISSLVGATARMILKQPSQEQDGTNSLRLIIYAIAISDEEWNEFEKRFQVKLCDVWGMTETLGATSINPINGKFKRNCVGLPRLGNEIKIVDEKGHDLPLGKEGEILVKGVPGRTIMLGYYKEPDATRKTIRNGWFCTGDRGFIDEDGYLHFEGRKKNIIKRAGENIAAHEVENILQSFPKVKDVAVVSLPDEIRDESVAAFVVLKDNEKCTEQEIVGWCTSRLASFKVPTIVRFIDKIPRDGSGSILREKLTEKI